MQCGFDARIPDGLLAANTLLAENSRQGFGASTHTVYQGFGDAISSTALGIPGTLYDGRVRCRYTGKERDTESGLDYFGARYYGSSMGRWTSPDPSGLAYADPTNPQSLNLYSYVLNNPLAFTDPDGLECVWDDGSFDSADDKDTGSHAQCSAAGGNYVDPKAFSTLGAGDWSSQANQSIANTAQALNSGSTVENVYANGNAPTVDVNFAYTFDGSILFGTQHLSGQADQIQQLATQVTADSDHYIGCIAAAEGVGGGGTAAYQSGQPTNPKPFSGEGVMPSSSPASETMAGAADALKIPRGRYPSPVGGPGTGMRFKMRTTPNAGRAAGRWLPILGLAADAYAAAQLWNCLGH
jgi:RHS repeat-associated protein